MFFPWCPGCRSGLRQRIHFSHLCIVCKIRRAWRMLINTLIPTHD
jgi:hypothetical protein